MKRILFPILTLVAILCGCARELEPEGSGVVPTSEYLVISADCTPMTRSDINQGKSTWEAGDKIAVIYKGAAYEYVAGTPSSDGRQTYFTSQSGISDYDGSALVAYYQALDAESGVVGIEGERSIAFQTDGQINSACAPLVGTSDSMENGVLNMSFRNIFSVMELRIDAAGYHLNSPAKTLKVEPAEGGEFEGYITCSGTVEPASLALEASQTGNVLTLNLPSSELREAQTLKFPVGRFSSSKGLKLTLTLEDGSELVKYVYKTGVSTFRESDGNFEVMHLARALFPFSGGISDAADLVAFASAVNSGASLFEYMNDDGKVVLLDDIDMSGVKEWTPIGNGTFTGIMSGQNVCTYTGNSFKGHFDGQGFAIKNLNLSASLTAEGATFGLFGILDGATVENVTLGAESGDNSSFTFSASATADAAVLAGVCYGSTIRNCTNYVPMTCNGNATASKRTTMGAFAGFVYNSDGGSSLEGLVNYGSITGKRDQSAGGATSVMAGGIAGAANGSNTSARNTIKDCVNYGNMTVDMERTSGIVATANQYTDLISCVNYGDQTNSYYNTRVGMIVSAVAGTSTLTDCENYGDAVMTATQVSGNYSRVGGLVGLLSSPNASIQGGGNYGKIVTDCTKGRGLLVAWFSDLKSMDGVEAGGSLYTYNGGDHQQVDINASNYMTYIGSSIDAADSPKITNIIYKGPDAVGIKTADELMEFASLVNSGGDYSKFENLSGVVSLAADIDMSGKTWTPIGQVVYTLSSNKFTFTEDKSFKGHFNGNGYRIKNLDMVCTNSTAGSVYGLFGALGTGAVVENVVMDASSSLTVNATAQTDCGVIAGLVYEATVKDVVNYAPVTYNTGASDKRMTMGVVGMAFANTSDAVISGVVNHAAVNAADGGSTLNNANGVHTAAILGFSTNQAESTSRIYVRNCVNRGNVVSASGRAATIVGACNRHTTIEGCANYGTLTNSFTSGSSGRIGGVTVILGEAGQINDTENHGDVICTTGAAAGSIVCLVNSADCQMSNVRNYGDVITDHSWYKGTFFGQCNYPATFHNCIDQGDLGKYNGGNYQMVGTNAANYFDYVGDYGNNAPYVIPLNIRYDNSTAQAPVFPAQWMFSAETKPLYETSWISKGIVPSTYSSPATITVVRAEANAANAFTRVVEDGSGAAARPYVGNMLEGDYWLWTLPVDYAPAGSLLLFNAAMSGGKDSPKYFVVEYFDEGKWKQASLLRTIPEDTSKEYTFMVHGVQNGGKYQHSLITKTLELKEERINSTIMVRMRVAADISCSGGKLSLDSADGTCSLAPINYTGSYVNLYPPKTFKDSMRLLCIGNSFSHYGDPTWKLVELALAEGHHIDLFSHLKGGQIFEDHLTLELTANAIEMGGFDYAFIQDQSQAHGKYAQDPTTDESKATFDNTGKLVDMILAKTPDCPICLESTWSYPNKNESYGGFGSYEAFDELTITGTKMIAKDLGLQVSPIGVAFTIAREKAPFVEFFVEDDKHQSQYGAYLKACVNYLVLFGEKFGPNPADCGLNPTHTAALRAAAEEAVLGHESDYFIAR